MTEATYHVPVLLEAAVDALSDGPEGTLLDGTLGGGGHTAALLERCMGRRKVIGVDQDLEALSESRRRLGSPENLQLVQGNFGNLGQALRGAGIEEKHPLAGILLDLGVSSWQLDAEARGFGFKHAKAPLDMRMDPSGEGPTARELIAESTVDELARILRSFGDVRRAFVLATRMKEALDEGELHTTRDLADLVEGALGRRRKGEVHPATTVFQALRISVNGELDVLDKVLREAPSFLKEGGRLVIISYHSLEDRRVKHAFREGERGATRPRNVPPPLDWRPTWKVLTKRPVVADEVEVGRNPRARSAKMRIAARAPMGVAR